MDKDEETRLDVFHTLRELDLNVLKAFVNPRDFWSRETKSSFSLYYITIRIRGDDNVWSGRMQDLVISAVLNVSFDDYRDNLVKYGANLPEEPCIVSYFKDEKQANTFVEEYLDPLIIARKFSS